MAVDFTTPTQRYEARIINATQCIAELVAMGFTDLESHLLLGEVDMSLFVKDLNHKAFRK